MNDLLLITYLFLLLSNTSKSEGVARFYLGLAVISFVSYIGLTSY